MKRFLKNVFKSSSILLTMLKNDNEKKFYIYIYMRSSVSKMDYSIFHFFTGEPKNLHRGIYLANNAENFSGHSYDDQF